MRPDRTVGAAGQGVREVGHGTAEPQIRNPRDDCRSSGERAQGAQRGGATANGCEGTRIFEPTEDLGNDLGAGLIESAPHPWGLRLANRLGSSTAPRRSYLTAMQQEA